MITLRPSNESELETLSDLALRSKAVWGYDAAFMDACKAELTLTPADLRDTHLQVAEDGEGIIGFVQIEIDGVVADLAKLFIEPARLRTGAGRRLFDWAVETARAQGATRLTIEADPDAAPFYRRMGARDVGTAPSGSIPGRRLPLLELDL